jgi:hypothetical protein
MEVGVAVSGLNKLLTALKEVTCLYGRVKIEIVGGKGCKLFSYCHKTGEPQ